MLHITLFNDYDFWLLTALQEELKPLIFHFNLKRINQYINYFNYCCMQYTESNKWI